MKTHDVLSCCFSFLYSSLDWESQSNLSLNIFSPYNKNHKLACFTVFEAVNNLLPLKNDQVRPVLVKMPVNSLFNTLEVADFTCASTKPAVEVQHFIQMKPIEEFQ